MLVYAVLFLWVGEAESHPFYQLKPTFHLTDSLPAEAAQNIGYPYDAMIENGRLYVTDYYNNVLVFSPSELLLKIGQRGNGPAEFAHAPVQIERIHGLLAVTEMYRRSRLFFKDDGTFVKREKLNREMRGFDGQTYIMMENLNAQSTGHLYFLKDSDCFLGKIGDDFYREYHLGQAVLCFAEDKTYLVYQRGEVEIYSSSCEQISQFKVPVEVYKKEIIKDPLGSGIQKQLRSSHITTFQFGIPVIDAEVDDEGYLWLLVSDENYETDLRRPGLVYLFRVNLSDQTTDFKIQLLEPVNNIRISGDHLIFVCTEYATVKAYPIDEVREIATKFPLLR